MRIVSELEEAGEEDVVTMMNTVVQPAGDPGELAEVQQALENLVHADLIRMSMDRDSSGRLKDFPKNESLDVIADLESGLSFNRERMLWTDTRHPGPPYADPFPYIVNTETGRKKGFEILDERGYQWWRRK